MIRNYIIIAMRTLLRNKSYTLINVLGLSLGVACCLLLALYIQDEMSYDKHHQDVDNVYRITTHFIGGAGLNDLASTSPPIAPTLKNEIPEIVEAARMVNPPGVAQNLIKYGDKLFYETNGFLADSTLFKILTYEFIEGNPKKALTQPNSVVLIESIARKLFGNESALDKIISITQGYSATDYKITGVIKSQQKSFIEPHLLISMTTNSDWGNYLRSENAMGQWAGQNFVPAFVKLQQGASIKDVEAKMNQVLTKHGAEDMKAIGFTKTLKLEPVKDVYLKSDIGQSPRINYLYVIASIAAFILLIACINFINLSTAKASQRANEVGVRKVMGAFRSSLIKQFMGEAILIVVISIVISIVIVQISLPWFNSLTSKTILFNNENIIFFIVVITGIALLTGLVAGSYPAIYLSSFQPAQVLKGKSILSNASGRLRKSLVVFQFVIAIALGCIMIIISQQLTFMQSKSLGFNQEAKIVLPLRTNAAKIKYESLKKELEKENFVKSISATEYIPGSTIWSDMGFYGAGGNMETAIMIRRNTVDAGYIEMMGIKLIAGRSFSSNRESESKGKVILNRSSAKKFGLDPDKAIGQPLYFDFDGKKSTFEIIGVIEDYHQTSLKEEIYPTLFELASATDSYANMMIEVNTNQLNGSLASIEATWKKLVNDTPFEYEFLDQSIGKQYDEDRKVSKIITSFTFIAMFISCLGLYGLSTFMAERRFKEIGVRKVMGASVNQIVSLMSSEFIKLITISFIIAVPLSWFAMDRWLQEFAYKTTIGIMVFIYVGGAALAIALITVSFESIKAAMANPTKSLRSE